MLSTSPAPKPNAPNSPAWTLPLGNRGVPPCPVCGYLHVAGRCSGKPRPGSRAARVALWTAPLTQVTVQTRRVP